MIDVYEFEKMQNYKEAIVCYSKIIKSRPDSKFFYYKKAEVLFKSGQIKECFEVFDEIIKRDPKDEKSIFYKGFFLQKMKSYHKAIVCYDKTIKLNAAFTHAHHNKKHCLEKVATKQDAKQESPQQQSRRISYDSSSDPNADSASKG